MFIRSLTSRSARRESGVFVCEGRKLAEEMIASGLKVRKIYETEGGGFSGRANLPVEKVSMKEMERVSSLKTPTSVLALVEIPVFADGGSGAGSRADTALLPDPAGQLIIALDDVQDPGNLGTIIRVADWFGIRHIVCSEATVDCLNPKVVQATMGAIARVQVHYTGLAEYLSKQKNAGVPIYGTFMDGENIYQSDLTPTGVILMGNEGSGINEKNAETVSYRLGIPAYPAGSHGSESLNVAVATAIVCSEFRRRLLS